MSDLALKLIRTAKEKRLTRLELGRCGLTELPEELFVLEWLEELVVSNVYWDDEKAKWIESQNQGQPNRLSRIPGSISRLIKLRELFIMGDLGNPWELRDLTPLATLANLQDLYVFDTQVSDLSPLEKLTNLQRLYVGATHVSDLSPLEKLTNLQWLVVDATQVSDLSSLKKLTKLQGLYVDHTPVSDLLPLERLTNLQMLTVNHTPVSDLSPLEKLTNLQMLAVSETQVNDLRPLLALIEKGIPVEWDKSWWKGSGIYVQDCPLTQPLPEIVQQGNEAILNYFRQIEEQGGTEPLYEAWLLIVGEPGAGKTSLMKKLLDPTYRVPPPQGEESTVGINVHEGWAFPYAPQPAIAFTANLWDFGGQEIQYMTHQFFLSPRSPYVLAADDRKQHTNFPYWFEVIHLLGKGEDGTQSPILVALNENNHKSVTNYDHRA
jgi:internalin A